MEKRSHRARWVEGLDWIRVGDIVNPDFGGSPELYVKFLCWWLHSMEYVHGEKFEEEFRAEAMRRVKAKEMPDEQAACYLEALRRFSEETGRDLKQLEKILRRGQLHVVK